MKYYPVFFESIINHYFCFFLLTNQDSMECQQGFERCSRVVNTTPWHLKDILRKVMIKELLMTEIRLTSCCDFHTPVKHIYVFTCVFFDLTQPISWNSSNIFFQKPFLEVMLIDGSRHRCFSSKRQKCGSQNKNTISPQGYFRYPPVN